MTKLLAAALSVALGLGPTAAVAAAPTSPATKGLHKGVNKKNPLAFVPVAGRSIAGASTVTIHGFMRQGNGIVAMGVFTGAVRDASGNIISLPAEAFTAPVVLPAPLARGGISTQQTGPAEPGVCDILFLEIGPINLNLLGLVLDTQPIVIDLDAQPGPGNLLGNLLCALVGLLDPVAILATLDQIVTFLNQTVALLQML